MNFRTFCLVVFLVFTPTHSHSWFETPKSPLEDPSQPFRDVSAFFEGFFHHFNLTKPSQIIDCFSQHTASTLFKDLYKAHKLLLAMNNREVLPLRSEFFKHYLFGIIDPTITACIALTQDLSNLLNELGVDRRDPQVFANTNFLYSQAHYDKLLKDFVPIIRDLDTRSFFSAGKSYGALISHLISSVKNEGMGYLAIKGFCNGFENFVQVEDPVDLLTERSFYLGGIAMELLQELATVVSEGEWEEAYENTVTFWEEKGRKVIEQIPSSIWDRLGLYENKHMTEIVGSHILNWIYDEKRMKYIKKHQLNYYTRMKLIKDNLNHLHVIQAGYLYAEFIKGVDASPEDIY